VKTPQKKTERKAPAPKPYRVEMLFNGLKTLSRTDNINEAILSKKPELLYTEMYVTVKRGDDISERKLNLLQGRKLFNDENFREIFINNLLLN